MTFNLVFLYIDPDVGSLPESYFLDTEDNSGNSLSDGEEQRQPPTPSGRTRTDSGSFNRYTTLHIICCSCTSQ
jgi:hypothetical protein